MESRIPGESLAFMGNLEEDSVSSMRLRSTPIQPSVSIRSIQSCICTMKNA